jgi:hypothetical protein
MGVTTMLKSKLTTGLAAAIIGITLTGTTKATPITYAVAIFDGSTPGAGVGGSITTDGTLGLLTPSNVIDWNLIGTGLNGTSSPFFFDLTGPLSGNNSQINFFFNVVAAPLTLTFVPNPPLPPNPCIPIGPNANCGTAGTVDIIGTGPTQNEIFMSIGVANENGTFVPTNRLFICETISGLQECGGSSSAIPTDGVFADGKLVPTASVPGPIVGSGLPGLILACGVLLTLARRRRQIAC